MKGKFPGIPVTSNTYNLFPSNRERNNAKAKEKAFRQGKPFYWSKELMPQEDGTTKEVRIQRLTMEHAELFNKLNNVEEAIYEEQWRGTDNPTTEANLAGGTGIESTRTEASSDSNG